MTAFWDSSAAVATLVSEPRSGEVGSLLRSDPRMVAWWATPLECLAALAQGERAGEYGRTESAQARAALEVLRASWTEILPSEDLRERAATLLRRHPLRAADSLQLAAALTWAAGSPAGHRFVTLDLRLAEAAGAEGFTPVPAPT